MTGHATTLRRAMLPCATDLARFEPQSPLARRKVDELLHCGAVVTQVRRTQVTLRRGEQTATIDGLGRVEWAS